MNLYTFGYRGYSTDDLQDHLNNIDSLHSVVVDIRYVPYSKMMPFWSKENLQEKFGDKYFHIKALGNKNYKEKGKIEILDLESGIEKLIFMMGLGFKCLILCACEDVLKCHRKFVSDEIQKRTKCEVIHL